MAPRRKKATKDPIVDLKRKLNKAIHEKNSVIRKYEDEDLSSKDHYCKYRETKHPINKRGFSDHKKIMYLNTKIQKLSKKLKDMHEVDVDIGVDSNHPVNSNHPVDFNPPQCGMNTISDVKVDVDSNSLQCGTTELR